MSDRTMQMNPTDKSGGRVIADKVAIGFTSIIFLLLLVLSLYKGLFRTHGNDLTIYLRNANLFFGGTSPYEGQWGSLYPLFYSFIVQPLNYLPIWMAHLLWFATNAFLIIVSLKVAQNRVVGKRFSWVAFGIMLVLLFDIFQSQMLNAQINIIVLALALGFLLFLKEGKENLAAICLAASISIKLVPVLLLLFLLINRRYGVALKTVAGVFVFSFAVPYIVVGHELFGYYEGYLRVIAGMDGSGLTGGELLFQQGLIGYSTLIWAGFGILLVSVLNVAVNRKINGVSYRMLYLYFILLLIVVPSMLQTHHMVWLLPPVLALLHDLYLETNRSYSRKYMAVAMVAFLIIYNVARLAPSPMEVYLLSIAILSGMTALWIFDEPPRILDSD